MLEKNIERFVFFGTALRYLQDTDSHYLVKATPKGGWGVVDNIEEFLRQLQEMGLTVTWRAARKLREIKGKIEEADEKTLTEERAAEIRDIMKELRPTLEAEAAGMVAYIVSERRFRTDHLLKYPERLFAAHVFRNLSEFAQKDFAESAKCLAFERPTAAAFHMLRAVEAILRDYYCQKVSRKRCALMWGPIVHSMKSAPRKFPKTIVAQLDHIREAFRNPTAHPEKVYDIDEAQDLLAICVDAANRIVADLDAQVGKA
jgi:hypothetical protein